MLAAKKGFTILEMAIVIGIVGLIGFFTVPKIIKIVQHSKIETTRNQLLNLREEVVGYFLMKQELPSDNLSELGEPRDAWKSVIRFVKADVSGNVSPTCTVTVEPDSQQLIIQRDNGEDISRSVAFFIASDGPNYIQQWDRDNDIINLHFNDEDREFDDIYQFVTLGYLQRRLCAQEARLRPLPHDPVDPDDISFNFSLATSDEISAFINDELNLSPNKGAWGAAGEAGYEGGGGRFESVDASVLSNTSLAGGQGQFIYTPIPKGCDTYRVRSVARTTPRAGSGGHGYGIFFDTIVSSVNTYLYPGYILQFDPGYSKGEIVLRRRWGNSEENLLYRYRDREVIPELNDDLDWWYDLHFIELLVDNAENDNRSVTVSVFDLTPGYSFAYASDPEDPARIAFTEFENPDVWTKRLSFIHDYSKEFTQDDTLYTGFRAWGTRSYFYYLGIKMLCGAPVPIAEYRFDECAWDGSDDEVVDSSGNEQHGRIFGTPVLEKGLINNSARFINNERMGIQLPNDSKLKPENEISISAWIKRNAILNEGLQNIYHFGNWQQYLRIDQTSDIVFSLTSKGTLRASGVADNVEWNHVAATYDGNDMSLYFNGDFVASRQAQGEIEYTGNQFIIGNVSTGSFTSFNGKIDELKIFGAALSPEQVDTVYKNEKSGLNWDGTARIQTCP